MIPNSLTVFRPLASSTGTPMRWDGTADGLAGALNTLAAEYVGAKAPNVTPGYLLAEMRPGHNGRQSGDIASRPWLVLDIDGHPEPEPLRLALAGYVCVAQRSLSGKGWHLHLPLAASAFAAEYDEIVSALVGRVPGVDSAGSRWAQTLYPGKGPAEIWCPDGVPLYVEGTKHALRAAVAGGAGYACVRAEAARYALAGSRDALRIRVAGWIGAQVASGDWSEAHVEQFWAEHFSGRGYTLQPSADANAAIMVARTMAFAAGDAPAMASGEPKNKPTAADKRAMLQAWRDELAGRFFRCEHDSDAFVDSATGRISSRRKLSQALAKKFDPDAAERPFDVFGDMLAVGMIPEVDMRGVFNAPEQGWVVERCGRFTVNRTAKLVEPRVPPSGWAPPARWDHWVGAFSPEAKAFLGHIIARPWEKPSICLVLQGPSGEGKSSVVSGLLKRLAPNLPEHNDILGREQVCQRSLRAVTGRFNGDTAGKLVVCLGEEDTSGHGGAARRAEKAEQLNVLKELITDPEIACERKGAEVVRAENRTRYILTTEEYLAEAAANLVAGNRRFLCQYVFAGLHLHPAEADEMFTSIAEHPEWYAWILANYWFSASDEARDTVLHGVRPTGEDAANSGSAYAFAQVIAAVVAGDEPGELANPTLAPGRMGGSVRQSITYDEVRALCLPLVTADGIGYAKANVFSELASIWAGRRLQGRQLMAFHLGMHLPVPADKLKATLRVDGAVGKYRAITVMD